MSKNYTKHSYKTRQEWLSARGIGGSDAAAVCNKSKWKTDRDVYNSLTSSKPKTEKKNTRMIQGTLAEEHIRALFAIEHPEYQIISPPKKTFWMFKRKDYPLITLTPDGLIIDKKNNKKFGLEIKHIELRKREQIELWLNDTLPDDYYFQTLHYLVGMNDLDGVCLVARLCFFKFNEDNEYVLDHIEERTYWIIRDEVEGHVLYLEKKEISFIENNIKPGKRPPVIVKI